MTSSEPWDATHLRLVWPQWQGAGTSSVASLLPEFPFETARRGYAVGTAVLGAILPEHPGPTVVVPNETGDTGLEIRDGVEAKTAVLRQLRVALDSIAATNFARISTLGGDCSVSVAPFTALARLYRDDLAVIWIDSHPDIGTGASEYPGYHAMAVSAITGHGDPDIVGTLPAIVPAERVALVGLHEWTEDDIHNVTDWGITSFTPDALRNDSVALLRWIEESGMSHVAIHFDVDTVDGNEVVFGLGAAPAGLTTDQVSRIVRDISTATDVVGLTVAEFIPRQVMHLQRLLRDFPLLSSRESNDSAGPAS